MTELPSIPISNCFGLKCPCPILLSHCLGQGQYGPLRASEGGNSRPVEIDHPRQVVASRHHRHGEVRAHLDNRADHLSTHLLDGGKDMLDSATGLGNPLAPALDMIVQTRCLEPRLARFRGVTPVGIDIPTGVRLVENRIEMLRVMDAGRAGLDLADYLVLLVDIDRELEWQGKLDDIYFGEQCNS